MSTDIKTKICRDCKVSKPLADYYKRQDSHSYKPICKPCCSITRKRYPINTNYIPKTRDNGFAKLTKETQYNIISDIKIMAIKQVADKYNIKYTTLYYWKNKGLMRL